MNAAVIPDCEGFPEPGTVAHASKMAEYARRPRRTYDWPSIRERFVEGAGDGERHTWPTLTEVAEHFEVSHHRLRDVSAEEGWVEQRQRWQAKVERERQQRKAQLLAEQSAQLDASGLQVARDGLALCARRLAAVAEVVRHGPGSSGGEIDARELERLGRAADLLHRLGQRAVGTPTLVSHPPLACGDDIAGVLRRDDPQRLTAVLSILASVGIGDAALELDEEPLAEG